YTLLIERGSLPDENDCKMAVSGLAYRSIYYSCYGRHPGRGCIRFQHGLAEPARYSGGSDPHRLPGAAHAAAGLDRAWRRLQRLSVRLLRIPAAGSADRLSAAT